MPATTHIAGMVDLEKIQARFLQSYAKEGVIAPALKAAGIDRITLAEWRLDEDFEAAMVMALEDAVDTAEVEMRHRAIHGTVRILFHQGVPIWKRDPSTGEVILDDNFDPIAYTENERSDSLLLAYMKANRSKYRDNGKTALEHTGAGGAPLSIITEYILPDGKTASDYEQPAT